MKKKRGSCIYPDIQKSKVPSSDSVKVTEMNSKFHWILKELVSMILMVIFDKYNTTKTFCLTEYNYEIQRKLKLEKLFLLSFKIEVKSWR